jgi:hypothetical protein
VDRESVLELVSSVTIIKLIAKPDVPFAAANKLVVQTQALSSKFSMKSKYYIAWGLGKAGTEGNRKKEVYFTLSEQMEKLSNSLKYLSK